MSQSERCPLCHAENTADALACQACGTNLAQAAELASLRERVAQLEQDVALLRQERPSEQSPDEVTAPEPIEPIETEPSEPIPEPTSSILPDNIWQSEFWLNKVGIGLLLLALAFLFNYAVEQGWLTPAVRVGIGLLLGTGLLVFGYRLRAERPSFSQVLTGGGVAAYYISGFAAFQLYELIPYIAAFVFMILVTLLAFAISLRQNEAMLSLIGGLGGLATPFLLNNGSGNVIGLLIYTAIICIGLMVIYYVKGWQLVYWVANWGGWLILLLAMIGEDISELEMVTSDGLAVQIGIAVNLLLFWGIPVWRRLQEAHALSAPQLGVADSWIGERLRAVLHSDVYGSTLLNSLIAWALTNGLWDLSVDNRGWLSLGTAVFFALITYFLARHSANLAYMHGLVVLLFLTIAITQLLEDNWLFLAWALITASLPVAAAMLSRRSLSWIGHGYGLIIAIWLLVRLVDGVDETAVFNVNALTDLIVLLIALAVTFWLTASRTRLVYRIVIHVFFLALLWREFSELSGGQGVVTIAWGIYAIVLLVIAVYYQLPQLRTVAFATFFILVGKLFLVDLEAVETIWRILLFAGFGGLFLLISYFYGSWLGIGEEAGEETL
ncbi:MAG: DUF2339 domain-containing protein [Chloroflexota bacterium]